MICIRPHGRDEAVRLYPKERREVPSKSQTVLIRQSAWLRLHERGWTIPVIAAVFKADRATVYRGLRQAKLLQETLDELDIASILY